MALDRKNVPIVQHIAQLQSTVSASSNIAALITAGTVTQAQVNAIVMATVLYLRQGE